MNLSPLQINAASGLLKPPPFEEGLCANVQNNSGHTIYLNSPLINPLIETIDIANNEGVLSSSTLSSLKNLSPYCPALSNSGGSQSSGPPPNFYDYFPDYASFMHAYNTAQAYMAQTNQFIEGSISGQDYLSNTFNGMSDLITGAIYSLNPNIKGFAADLSNLGKLINMDALEDLGSPLETVHQIIRVTGYLPVLSLAFLTVGIEQQTVGTIGSVSASVSDETQKLIYQAMKLISGDALKQILKVLNVKTKNLKTAADLLNPKKLFPNSYTTLKTLTPNGYVNIYSGEGVNTVLATKLPAYVLRSTA